VRADGAIVGALEDCPCAQVVTVTGAKLDAVNKVDVGGVFLLVEPACDGPCERSYF
jgi:hypothetical protein